jgi:predicted transcriptional regulator
MAMPAPSPDRKAVTKTTLYLSSDVVVAAKILAAATGRSESRVVEDAIRSYLQRGGSAEARQAAEAILDRIAEEAPPISDDEAMIIAREGLKAVRRRAQ